MSDEKLGEGWNQPKVTDEEEMNARFTLPTKAENYVPVFLDNKKPPTEFTDERKQRFLMEMCRTGLRTLSAEMAGISIATVRRHEKSDPEFAALSQEAKDFFTDSLESEAHRRAVEGVLEPVFSQKTGEQIGVIRRYSDRLLEVLLRAGRPEKFRDQVQHEHKHTGGVLVVPGRTVTDADWENQFSQDASGDGVPKLTDEREPT